SRPKPGVLPMAMGRETYPGGASLAPTLASCVGFGFFERARDMMPVGLFELNFRRRNDGGNVLAVFDADNRARHCRIRQNPRDGKLGNRQVVLVGNRLQSVQRVE